MGLINRIRDIVKILYKKNWI